MTLNLLPNTEPMPEELEYFLVTGEIIFRTKDSETPGVLRVNTVVTSSDGRLPVTAMGRAQQGLQLQFFKAMGDAELQVINVIILALAPLGRFTSEEFHAPPPGMELRDMKQTSVAGHA